MSGVIRILEILIQIAEAVVRQNAFFSFEQRAEFDAKLQEAKMHLEVERESYFKERK